MNKNNLSNQGKKGILWWTVIPSCFVAAIWSANFMSKLSRAQADTTLNGILSLISFPIFFVVFLGLVWPPLLGITLATCTLFRLAQPYYSRKVWIVFAMLLVPFCLCSHILLTMPTMSPYRQWFHLHQHADSRLSETQVLAIAAKILAEHKKNLADYKLRSVVFYPQTYGSPFPAKWQVIYYPQTPLVNGEPDTHRGVLVNVVDQTANAEYED